MTTLRGQHHLVYMLSFPNKKVNVTFDVTTNVARSIKVYFILYSENQCISKLYKIGIFIDMKFH